MMLYFTVPTGDPRVHEAIRSGALGMIRTPAQGNRPIGGLWCADNGCFSKKPFNADRWFNWLTRNAVDANRCHFAVAPDVKDDAKATLALSRPWFPMIRRLGYPAAYVLQDGQEDVPVPWDEFDNVFIGGSTGFKLGPVAADLAAQAVARHKPVHMGRVSSLLRCRYADSIGCDSVDGTYIRFGSWKNLDIALSWVREVNGSPTIFGTAP